MKALSFNQITKSLEIIHDVPIPIPKEDEVLVRIKAYRLNIPDHSSTGEDQYIEAAGFIVSSPSSSSSSSSSTVLLLLPHPSNGVYPEYAVVQRTHIHCMKTSLPWDILATMPKTFYIAWGALIRGLELKPKEMLLVRGSNNEIGIAAAAVGRSHGAYVVESSRKKWKKKKKNKRVNGESGKQNGEYHDEEDGEDEDICRGFPPFDKILHLSSPSYLSASFQCVKHGGMVCVVRSPGDNWTMEGVNLVDMIPSEAKLTVYKPTIDQFMTTPFQALIKQVELGKMRVDAGRVVKLDDIEEWGLLDIGERDGKVVVLM